MIDNVICDQISTTCVDIEDDALFTTMNQLYVTNPDAGARAGVLVRSGGTTRGTIVANAVFQNMVAGFAGIEVEAGVNSFEIIGNYFSGSAGTGIVVAAGASSRSVLSGESRAIGR